MSEKTFLDAKDNALRSLEKACHDELVDPGIKSVLDLLNQKEEYYTSSSCAGRVMVLQIPVLGDKQKAEILGKWHRVVTFDEVDSASKRGIKGMIWLLAQAPILHIGCDFLAAADWLVKLAGSCGFKNSSIKSTGKKILVEVCSTERLDAPLGMDSLVFYDERYLGLLVDISNQVIERSAQKLLKFEKKLGNI
jgi:tRNA wybutosine-synthesizing protein 3